MKINRVSVAILFASLLLMMAAIPSGAAVKGPREDDMAIYYYATQEAAYTALTAGEIDFIMYDLTSLQADNAFTNPNIVTVNVPDSGFYEFDLNNNYSISTYPGIRSPMNYSELRKAIAFLSDKDYYVGTLYDNKAVRIDQMVAAPYYGWADETKSYPYYPYEYDPAAAKSMLDSKFPVGTTPNPYYDAGDPLSSEFLRQYPADHSEAGTDLDPLIFYVRVEHNARLMSGRAIYQALRKMGVPIDATECPSSVSYAPVMGEFNYHFYTGGWSVGRFPPLSSYGLYHSVNAFPYGGNYVTGGKFPFVGDNATDPALYRSHPILDDYLYQCNYAKSYSDAVTYCKLANGYMTDICMNVPLWSVSSYWGWSNKLLGMVNQQGNDPENGYSFMNAYKADGTAIRCGTINYPTALNIVYSSWVYDYNNLDRMNLYGGVDVPAYNVAADQVGFVDYFETTLWNDGSQNLTKVVQSFREDGYSAKPVSGGQGENINASHYFFNAWLDYQIGDGWSSSGFLDLHHVNITGTYDFEIYFTTESYWNTYYCQGPLRPMDTWMAQGENFINQTVETIASPTTPGPIGLAEDPIWFDYVEFNGVPLTFMDDYNIVLGQLYIYSALGAGDLEVSYWYVPAQALRGYFPGNLAWGVIEEGAGMYYMVSYSTGVSTYKRNPFYYMVTPPLGEIDFVKKGSGNYKIDIYDLALAGGAFGSTGTGIPSSNWFPGADLAPTGGIIDIYDEVTVTGVNWDQEYDPTEP